VLEHTNPTIKETNTMHNLDTVIEHLQPGDVIKTPGQLYEVIDFPQWLTDSKGIVQLPSGEGLMTFAAVVFHATGSDEDRMCFTPIVGRVGQPFEIERPDQP